MHAFRSIPAIFAMMALLIFWGCNDNPPAIYDYADPVIEGDGDVELAGDIEEPDGDNDPDGTNLPDGDEEQADGDGVVASECIQRVASNGFDNPLNKYVASMAVFGDRLFVGTYNGDGGSFLSGEPDVSQGGELWAFDGENWDKVADNGFGKEDNVAITMLAESGGKLYAGTQNNADGAEVYVSSDGNDWSLVARYGLGWENNNTITTGVDYGGKLYVGTENNRDGALVLRRKGNVFQQVSEYGFDNPANTSITSLTVFRDALYAGTSAATGANLYRYTEENGEFDQITGRNESWDFPFGHTAVMSMTTYNTSNTRFLYVATANFIDGFGLFSARDGARFGKIGENGFGDRNNAYGWSMAQFGNNLYLGTFNQGNLFDPFENGGSLYRSDDGEDFIELVGENGVWSGPGINNDHNYGFSKMVVFEDRLYIGTAQCFFCEGRSGLEVWVVDDDACL